MKFKPRFNDLDGAIDAITFNDVDVLHLKGGTERNRILAMTIIEMLNLDGYDENLEYVAQFVEEQK